MAERKINVGVVGLGFMGQTHLRAYQQLAQARIVAVCDAVRLPKDGKLEGVMGNITGTEELFLDPKQIRAYRDFEEFLQHPDLELVDLCVPTKLHVPMSIAALEAGKHVICEKPLARTSEGCRKILEVAAKSPGYFMPAMCLRFWPEWAWLREVIQKGTYGKVLSMVLQRLSEPPAWSRDSYFKGEESGGALLDMHIHDTDFVQFCFGVPKEVVSTGQIRFSGAYDYVSTIYRYENGPSITAEGSWLVHKGFGFKMAYRVDFEKATVDYDSSRGEEALRVFEEGKEPQTLRLDWPDPDGYVGELRHMLECIANGRPPSVVTGEDGLRAVQICEAEEQSAKTGQPVRIE